MNSALLSSKKMKLGSLFDGSGGFPLAGALCGITPVWASEVEPYPIAVTRSRFPEMRHLGDVSRVSGADIEPVDIITFGSPCQDLSVAGKRAGLKHTGNGDEETTRSGLFMEAVRIIKEMRRKTDGRYPAFALWENVPGAFSSNKGEDFRIVLEELIRIAEPEAPPLPAAGKNGWPYADCIVGDGWSVAWRVFDAQYWGVPQRRRRIYLVADFGGDRAGKVLFEREGLRGYFAEGRTPWKETSAHAGGSPAAADREGELIQKPIPINTMLATRCKALGRGTGFGVGEPGDPQFTISAAHEHAVCYAIPSEWILNDQGGQQISVEFGTCPTLRAEAHGNLPCVLHAAGFKAGQSMAGGIGWQEECAATLSAQCSGTEPTVCVCYDARGNGGGKTAPTITGDHNNRVTDYTALMLEPVYCLQGNAVDRHAVAYSIGNGQPNSLRMEEIAKPLDCMHDPQAVVTGCLTPWGNQARRVYSANGVFPALAAREKAGQNQQAVCTHYIVRRLTPTECARLQGFPDQWGAPDYKGDFTDVECAFWQEVRDTYAEIGGKPKKRYTKAQLLKWYNGLHTDSAEYKMWGNGIALPTALYVMQGIAEALSVEKEEHAG